MKHGFPAYYRSETPCVRCGRCCSYMDVCRVVPELTADDLAAIPENLRNVLVGHSNGRCGIRSIVIAGRSVCSALEWQEDGTTKCALQKFKPTQCREWEAGGPLCVYYRSLPMDVFWRNGR